MQSNFDKKISNSGNLYQIFVHVKNKQAVLERAGESSRGVGHARTPRPTRRCSPTSRIA